MAIFDICILHELFRQIFFTRNENLLGYKHAMFWMSQFDKKTLDLLTID